MAAKFTTWTAAEREIVNAIVERAIDANIYDDAIDAHMDLSATHVHCPLRLAELRDADQFNFAHDMYGIQGHLDRSTGKLTRCLLPRFAAPPTVIETR
jgi:hypothetical protein